MFDVRFNLIIYSLYVGVWLFSRVSDSMTAATKTTEAVLKGALYRIWCGMNRLGDSGVKVV